MITKKTEFGMITILPDGQVQLREDSIYEDEGVEVARKYHRRVLEPDDTHTETDVRVVKVIDNFWTADVIREYKEKKARNQLIFARESQPVIIEPVVTEDAPK